MSKSEVKIENLLIYDDGTECQDNRVAHYNSTCTDKGDFVCNIGKDGIVYISFKESAIEEIKSQPFFR